MSSARGDGRGDRWLGDGEGLPKFRGDRWFGDGEGLPKSSSDSTVTCNVAVGTVSKEDAVAAVVAVVDVGRSVADSDGVSEAGEPVEVEVGVTEECTGTDVA